MDLSSIMQMGANLFIDSEKSGEKGSEIDLDKMVDALAELLGANKDGEAEDSLDIGSIVSSLGDGSLVATVQSWLGSGDNDAIAPEQVSALIGQEKVVGFADQLGVSEEEALGGLADALPNIVDQASNAGLYSMAEIAGNLLGE